MTTLPNQGTFPPDPKPEPSYTGDSSGLPPSEVHAATQRVAAVAGLFGDSERNWSEDFGSENGAYGHVCRDCGQSFVGYKRRPDQCRKCALVAKAKWDALTPEQQAEEEKAVMAWLKAHSPNIGHEPRAK